MLLNTIIPQFQLKDRITLKLIFIVIIIQLNTTALQVIRGRCFPRDPPSHIPSLIDVKISSYIGSFYNHICK